MPPYFAALSVLYESWEGLHLTIINQKNLSKFCIWSAWLGESSAPIHKGVSQANKEREFEEQECAMIMKPILWLVVLL